MHKFYTRPIKLYYAKEELDSDFQLEIPEDLVVDATESFMIPVIALESSLDEESKLDEVLQYAKDAAVSALFKVGRKVKDAVDTAVDKAIEYSDSNNRKQLLNESRLEDLADRVKHLPKVPETTSPLELEDYMLRIGGKLPKDIKDIIEALEDYNQLATYLNTDYIRQINKVADAYIDLIKDRDYATLLTSNSASSELIKTLDNIGFIKPNLPTKVVGTDKAVFKLFESDGLLANRVFKYKVCDTQEAGFKPFELLDNYYQQTVTLERVESEDQRSNEIKLSLPTKQQLESLVELQQQLVATLAELNRQVVKNTVPEYERRLVEAYTGKEGAIAKAVKKLGTKALVNTIGTDSSKSMSTILSQYPKWTVELILKFIDISYNLLSSLTNLCNKAIKQY